MQRHNTSPVLVVVTTGGTVRCLKSLTLFVKELVSPIIGCEVVMIASVVVRGSKIVMHNHQLELCTSL